MIRYEFIRPPQNPEAATRFLADNFLPLMEEYWKARGADWYGAANWDINALEFTRLWMQQTFILVLAYEDDKPAGFLLGAKIRPLLYEETVLQIDQWYGRSPEIENGLFAYLNSILKFFQVGEVRVPKSGPVTPVYTLDGFEKQTWEMARFVLKKE